MARVFKYRMADDATFERDIESLKNDYFWSATRNQLNDPFEGMFKLDALNIQIEWIEKLCSFYKSPSVGVTFEEVKIRIGEVLAFVDKLGIFSLSKNSMEELLWAHYGNSHKGFCVEYDLDKLLEFEREQYNCITIEYRNKPAHITLPDLVSSKTNKTDIALQKMLGVKSKSWNYEREVRITTTLPGKQPYDFRAVKAIYFGHRMEESKQSKIMEALAGRGISYHKIEIAKGTYNLTSVSVADPFINAPRYRYSIGQIEEWAIFTDNLEPELEKYKDYLYKATEIIRREPYCDLVEIVDFSPSKGNLDAPVIFVQYQRLPNKFVTHYLTLSEIDEQFMKISDLQ